MQKINKRNYKDKNNKIKIKKNNDSLILYFYSFIY